MKKILIILILLGVACLGFLIQKKPSIDLGGPVKPNLQLKTTPNRIFDSKVFNDNGTSTIKYAYYSDVVIPAFDGEDISKRTNFSRTKVSGFSQDGQKLGLYKKNGEDFIKEETTYYSQGAYIKMLDGTWHEIEYATTTEDAFRLQGGTISTTLWKPFGQFAFIESAWADTSTTSPDADTESTSVDGYVLREATNESWATIRAGAGTSSGDADTAIAPIFIDTGVGGDKFFILRRGIFLFDTSALPDTDTIDSATFEFVSSGKNNNAGFVSTSDLDVHLVSSTPASNTALVNADYSQTGSTSFGSKTYDSVTTDSSTYNSITIDATGRATISKTGVTKFGIRCGADFSDTAPSYTNTGNNSRITFILADEAGSSQDPLLVIVHSSAVATPSQEDLILFE